MECIDRYDNFFNDDDLFLWFGFTCIFRVNKVNIGKEEMLIKVRPFKNLAREKTWSDCFVKSDGDLPLIYKVKKIFNEELTCLI